MVQKFRLFRALQWPDAGKNRDPQMLNSTMHLAHKIDIEHRLGHHKLRAGRHLPFQPLDLRVQVLRVGIKSATDHKICGCF